MADGVHTKDVVDVKPRGEEGGVSHHEADTGHFIVEPHADGRHDHHAAGQARLLQAPYAVGSHISKPTGGAVLRSARLEDRR